MPKIAYVRGADLNPWQLHAFRQLEGEFELVAIGSKTHHFENRGIPMKVLKGLGLGGLRVPGWLRFLRRWFARDTIVGLDRLLEGSGLVHTVDIAAGYSYQALQFCESRGVPLLCTVYENIPWVHEEIPRLARQKEALRRGVALFLPVTQRAADNLILEGVEPSRIEVLSPGVDLDHFRPVERVADGVFRVFYSGRLVPEKGLRFLIHACAIVHRRGVPVELTLAGSGPERANLEVEVGRCGLHGRVHFAGYVPYSQTPRFYAACDCVVLPSLLLDTWHEQFGLILAEALACGKPVIGSDCGSIPEVLGPVGILFSVGDPFALAERLFELARDPEAARRRGAEGRRWAEQSMDARRVGERLAEIYRRLSAPAPVP